MIDLIERKFNNQASLALFVKTFRSYRRPERKRDLRQSNLFNRVERWSEGYLFVSNARHSRDTERRLTRSFLLGDSLRKSSFEILLWTEFIFEIDPEYLEAREAESFVSELHRQMQVSKDEIDIDVTFSSECNIVDTVFKAITFEAATTGPGDEYKIQSNDDFFRTLRRKFALLPGESSSVWEIALSDLFPYVNAITILVLIEHGLEVDKVVKDRKLTREDYKPASVCADAQ